MVVEVGTVGTKVVSDVLERVVGAEAEFTLLLRRQGKEPSALKPRLIIPDLGPQPPSAKFCTHEPPQSTLQQRVYRTKDTAKPRHFRLLCKDILCYSYIGLRAR
jgi:hypothetical protein